MLYGGYLAVVKGIEIAHYAVQGLGVIVAHAYAVATHSQIAPLYAAAAAQMGLNAAMLASPITWIILLIIALIAIIYLVVAAINKWTGNTISATGVIMGVFYTLGGRISTTTSSFPYGIESPHS